LIFEFKRVYLSIAVSLIGAEFSSCALGFLIHTIIAILLAT